MSKRLTRQQIKKFQKTIYRYYHACGRHDLPWRKTKRPYHILVSEIMLQQTQVERVIPKYRLFLKTFPSIKSLAQAPLSDVIAVWQGLGYNRRAVALKKSARLIIDNYNGRLPRSPGALQNLPGVGHATASAVAAFAFNQPVLFIETNIRTVYIYHFYQSRKKIHDDDIYPLLEQTIDTENPRQWYYALMDYGVYLKKRKIKLNDRSVHYTKQSRFEGSIRQTRGEIIRLLAQNGGMTRKEIGRKLTATQHNITDILKHLEKDGLVRKTGRTFVIA